MWSGWIVRGARYEEKVAGARKRSHLPGWVLRAGAGLVVLLSTAVGAGRTAH